MKQGTKVKRETLVTALLLVTGATSLFGATLALDPSLLRANIEQRQFEYADWKQIDLGSNGSFAVGQFLLELHDDESLADIQITAPQQLSIGYLPRREDLPTSDQFAYDLSVIRQDYPSVENPGEIDQELVVNGNRYAQLRLAAVSQSADGSLWLNQEFIIGVGARTVAAADLLPLVAVNHPIDPAASSGTTVPEYLIVTSEALAPALEPLKRYRLSTGYHARIVTMEEIESSVAGVDAAEKLREYLKASYSVPGNYLLLAGDETVVPIRLTYHSTDHSDTAISPVNLQITDLYYADLTGDWDRDHDGTYGERIDDAADLSPELLVGRLPFNRAEDFQTYTDKLILYESNPGVDRSWLTRAFFYSSDQMRDLNAGQHNQIAAAYPDNFTLDSVTGVEATRGDDPAPSNLAPSQLASVVDSGFGIVNIIAHGRSDGFVLKSANYNEWPKTLMLTESAGGHGKLADMDAEGKPAFYYSLACDNAQFDCDQPYFGATSPNLAQSLLADPNGAIGFVGHSRWGWVGTSFLLQRAFFDSLFAHPDRPAVQAMYGAKAAYYYYRDLVYGLNYLGDPALRVYQSSPVTPSILVSESDNHSLTVIADGQPMANGRVTLSLADSLLETTTTDHDGHARLVSEFDPLMVYSLSVSGVGSTSSRVFLSGSIVTDVEDDQLLPARFSLGQNFPNPFNPSTQISFSLAHRSHVTLTVFNLNGRIVTELLDQELPAGAHTVAFEGNSLASGVYFYRLAAEGFTETRKMVLLK